MRVPPLHRPHRARLPGLGGVVQGVQRRRRDAARVPDKHPFRVAVREMRLDFTRHGGEGHEKIGAIDHGRAVVNTQGDTSSRGKGCIDLNFECSTFCPILYGQKRLGKTVEHPNQSQPNPGP